MSKACIAAAYLYDTHYHSACCQKFLHDNASLLRHKDSWDEGIWMSKWFGHDDQWLVDIIVDNRSYCACLLRIAHLQVIADVGMYAADWTPLHSSLCAANAAVRQDCDRSASTYLDIESALLVLCFRAMYQSNPGNNRTDRYTHLGASCGRVCCLNCIHCGSMIALLVATSCVDDRVTPYDKIAFQSFWGYPRSEIRRHVI